MTIKVYTFCYTASGVGISLGKGRVDRACGIV